MTDALQTFHGADVRPAFAAPTPESIAPARLRRPLATVVEDAVAPGIVERLARWLHQHRDRVIRAASRDLRFEVLDFEDLAPDVAASLRRTVLDPLELPETLESIGVPEFMPTGVELVPTLLHHGGFRAWGDGWFDAVGNPAPMRRVGFELFIGSASEPVFKGGEVEFPNGDVVIPRPNRLAVFHPLQWSRTRAVECYSPDMLHGRWSVAGWILGFPPEGWLERVERLRGGV